MRVASGANGGYWAAADLIRTEIREPVRALRRVGGEHTVFSRFVSVRPEAWARDGYDYDRVVLRCAERLFSFSIPSPWCA